MALPNVETEYISTICRDFLDGNLTVTEFFIRLQVKDPLEQQRKIYAAWARAFLADVSLFPPGPPEVTAPYP